jgi:hypothetical protein
MMGLVDLAGLQQQCLELLLEQTHRLLALLA